jgi:hypothetical protein
LRKVEKERKEEEEEEKNKITDEKRRGRTRKKGEGRERKKKDEKRKGTVLEHGNGSLLMARGRNACPPSPLIPSPPLALVLSGLQYFTLPSSSLFLSLALALSLSTVIVESLIGTYGAQPGHAEMKVVFQGRGAAKNVWLRCH